MRTELLNVLTPVKVWLALSRAMLVERLASGSLPADSNGILPDSCESETAPLKFAARTA